MVAFIDITGQRFGRLVALSRSPNHKGKAMWLCRCDCDQLITVSGTTLRSTGCQSCGCLARDRLKQFVQRITKHGAAIPGRHRPEFDAWLSAKQRCTNPNNKKFQHYGGRGVKMCEEWTREFAAFLRDMGPCPKGHSLDRWPNKAGDYEPRNCRWATIIQQNNNTARNVTYEYQGGRYTIAELARAHHVGYMSLYGRLRDGRTVDDALARCRWYQAHGTMDGYGE